MQSFSLYGEEGAPSTVVTPATFVTEEDPQRDETPSVDASQDNSELQVTRDKLQIMQNVTGNVADEVAGDVIDEPITQQDQEAITTVDDASMNYDVANPTVNSTITTSPNTSILSDENNSVGNNVDDGRR